MAEIEYPHIPYSTSHFSDSEMFSRSESFFSEMNRRRSVRFFSDKPVPLAIMENLILTASSAPSGAHKQPWTFCLVGDPLIKSKIRAAAEQEERESYSGRMSAEWLRDLAPLGTDWEKPFLEIAPWLVICFRKSFDYEGQQKRKNYYVQESVGIACGLFLAAVQHVGLVALTHTPSPMDFLIDILKRPDNERPYLLIPVGHPSEDCTVPDLKRKTLKEVMVRY